MAAASTSMAASVAGPSALGGDFRRFVYLSYTLAVMEFKLRFFGSVLGYLWQLIRPLMLFGVLYFVFTQAIKLGDEVKFFPVLLLTNIVLYTFFAEATNGSVTSVVDRENLVRKIHFPRLAIPVSVVLTAAFNLALNLIVLLVFMLASGVTPRASWVALPVLLVILAAFALGMATILSVLYVRFRDIKPIWDVLLQVIFYGTPIIYAIETIDHERIRELFMLNPLAAIMQSTRHFVIDPSAPGAAGVAGGRVWLLIPAGLVVFLLVFGLWLFNRRAPRIAEEL
jgi:ABC-2 type transport system permease protein